ncbi:hypothetical protein TVAG_364610 [Trichomonas vaginalis G3]|uniref:Uncharacterized protein n=1 Tax=Trichomonas vaginalis (strain ATCC PRA-98 / G3) TaxID=412133 RepID=A2E9H2_TRIV3|nr:hypothetical protein TVAGG3_0001140 [Trichomonas vaginalis G3]EAY10736.1 hypothetical protein TVAG_364610 [Trichomonas vaginalis G3]KAI5538629.1 hypothetical protein TVAGG3_0001140 [Trichomonas vaginalis G3]|eukprot:XP_001322959.1 hypothetical protein [Trichomonas vaginalis G3]
MNASTTYPRIDYFVADSFRNFVESIRKKSKADDNMDLAKSTDHLQFQVKLIQGLLATEDAIKEFVARNKEIALITPPIDYDIEETWNPEFVAKILPPTTQNPKKSDIIDIIQLYLLCQQPEKSSRIIQLITLVYPDIKNSKLGLYLNIGALYNPDLPYDQFQTIFTLCKFYIDELYQSLKTNNEFPVLVITSSIMTFLANSAFKRKPEEGSMFLSDIVKLSCLNPLLFNFLNFDMSKIVNENDLPPFSLLAYSYSGFDITFLGNYRRIFLDTFDLLLLLYVYMNTQDLDTMFAEAYALYNKVTSCGTWQDAFAILFRHFLKSSEFMYHFQYGTRYYTLNQNVAGLRQLADTMIVCGLYLSGSLATIECINENRKEIFTIVDTMIKTYMDSSFRRLCYKFLNSLVGNIDKNQSLVEAAYTLCIRFNNNLIDRWVPTVLSKFSRILWDASAVEPFFEFSMSIMQFWDHSFIMTTACLDILSLSCQFERYCNYMSYHSHKIWMRNIRLAALDCINLKTALIYFRSPTSFMPRTFIGFLTYFTDYLTKFPDRSTALINSDSKLIIDIVGKAMKSELPIIPVLMARLLDKSINTNIVSKQGEIFEYIKSLRKQKKYRDLCKLCATFASAPLFMAKCENLVSNLITFLIDLVENDNNMPGYYRYSRALIYTARFLIISKDLYRKKLIKYIVGASTSINSKFAIEAIGSIVCKNIDVPLSVAEKIPPGNERKAIRKIIKCGKNDKQNEGLIAALKANFNFNWSDISSSQNWVSEMSCHAIV